MRVSRTIGFLLLFVAAVANAQGWSEAYDKALGAARAQKWGDARSHFQQAASLRAEDFSGPTTLPGSVTDPKRWRNGSPYSPNFGAAYCAYRAAFDAANDAEQSALLKSAREEFAALLAKGQYSREAFYFSFACLAKLRDVQGQRDLEELYGKASGKLNWKVDTEFVSPNEVADIARQYSTAPTPGDPSKPVQGNPTLAPAPVGTVPKKETKFALIIGQSMGLVEGLQVPFAAECAVAVREALIQHAGYSEGQVDVVQNGDAETLKRAAKALADRMPADGTVFIYFAGAGSNLDGRDYLMGVDAKNDTDTTNMMAKTELFKLFMEKGAKIFAFFEAHRPINKGRYFGMEVPLVGSISQMQATIPGDMVRSFVRNNKTVGIFADAMSSVITDLHVDRIPVTEYAWQVFIRMRRGSTGSEGGGSGQTPTLPVLVNMASNATF